MHWERHSAIYSLSTYRPFIIRQSVISIPKLNKMFVGYFDPDNLTFDNKND